MAAKNRSEDFTARASRRGYLLTASLVLALVLAVVPGALAEDPSAAAQRAARAVMTEFLEAFNARDEARWADTLHFPHVRLASQTVAVYPSREAFLDAMDLDAFARGNDWHHSTWDHMQVVQVSPHKVHVAVTFSRFRADGSRIASFDSLYVIEQVDERWGVRARSSFAP
jgi:hypothetical protein